METQKCDGQTDTWMYDGGLNYMPSSISWQGHKKGILNLLLFLQTFRVTVRKSPDYNVFLNGIFNFVGCHLLF